MNNLPVSMAAGLTMDRSEHNFITGNNEVFILSHLNLNINKNEFFIYVIMNNLHKVNSYCLYGFQYERYCMHLMFPIN